MNELLKLHAAIERLHMSLAKALCDCGSVYNGQIQPDDHSDYCKYRHEISAGELP